MMPDLAAESRVTSPFDEILRRRPARERKILDLSSGRRNVWFDRAHPNTVFVDIKETVQPSVVADSGRLPFADGSPFELVLFDPPHCNTSGDMAERYGSYKVAELR